MKIDCGTEQIVACLEGLVRYTRAFYVPGRFIGDSGVQLLVLKDAPLLQPLTSAG